MRTADQEELARLKENITTLKKALQEATKSRKYFKERAYTALEEVDKLNSVHESVIAIDRIWLGYLNFDPSNATAWHEQEFENREDFVLYFCKDYLTNDFQKA